MADVRKCRTRCWFTRYGRVGERLPRCTRCGSPNPQWSRERAEQVLMFGEDDVREREVQG